MKNYYNTNAQKKCQALSYSLTEAHFLSKITVVNIFRDNLTHSI